MAKLRYLVPIALAIGVLTVPAALGAGAADWIKIGGQGTIIDPAHVALGVTYSCLSTTTGSSSTGAARVDLQGAPGNGSGTSGAFSVICDDTANKTTVIVTGGPFTPGDDAAFGIVCGSGCGTTGVDAVEVVLK